MLFKKQQSIYKVQIYHKEIMKGIIFSILFSCLFLTEAYCQLNHKIASSYSEAISALSAKRNLSVIASDAFQGRETGTKGARLAANYLAAQFKALGLQAPSAGSYFLNIPLKRLHLTFDTFKINGQQMEYEDYSFVGFSLSNSVSADSLIFAGNGTEAEIENINVTGKVVMIIGDVKPGGREPVTITPALLKRKPALIISVIPISDLDTGYPGNKLQQVGFPSEFEDEFANKPLCILIRPRVANLLLKNAGKTYEQLKAGAGAPAVNLKAATFANYTSTWNNIKAADVIGYLPGIDPKVKNEVIIISAHYDHIGILSSNYKGDRINNGADDDGSGTVAVLELAKVFVKAKKSGHGPRRTILFLCNDGEEQGLLGSAFYVQNPVFLLSNTIANLNIDMIGRRDDAHKSHVNYCYIVGPKIQHSGLDQISERVNKTSTHLQLDYRYDTPNDGQKIYFRSDHYNFAKRHIPVIFYYNGSHVDYHSVTDEVKKIDFPLLIKRTKLIFFTAWDLANANQTPSVTVAAN
jgi:hypothetical protein